MALAPAPDAGSLMADDDLVGQACGKGLQRRQRKQEAGRDAGGGHRRSQCRDHVVAAVLLAVLLAALLAVFAGAGFWPPGSLP